MFLPGKSLEMNAKKSIEMNDYNVKDNAENGLIQTSVSLNQIYLVYSLKYTL